MAAIIDEYDLSKILPQKYPFRMIDKIIEFKKEESLTAVKNITGNEWVFEGQKNSIEVFPETLLMEAAAQTVLAFLKLNSPEHLHSDALFVLEKIKFEWFGFVNMGDQIQLKVVSFKILANGGYSEVEVTCGTQRIANTTVFVSLVKK